MNDLVENVPAKSIADQLAEALDELMVHIEQRVREWPSFPAHVPAAELIDRINKLRAKLGVQL